MNSKKDVQHVYLVGAKSLGAYGGYETFVYKLTEYHQNKENIKYHVACKANGDGCMDESKFDGVTKINEHEFELHNAYCFKIDVPQIGPAQAIYYDVAALKACCEHIKENHIPHPIVYIMACRIGPFAGYFYKEIHKLGGTVYLNPDGHEWMRAKWSAPIRKYWKISEQTIPVLLAAFQNVYLAIGISHQTALSLQIMLSLHFFLVLIVDLMNAQILFSKVSKIVWLIVIVIIQGTILYLAYPAPITSLISAGRNVLSCLVIYAYSCIIGENSDEKTYYKILNAVALIVVMFGLFEYIGGINIWRNLGITQLWNLKGITTNVAGVPMNWFSSETIGGQQIRRMVSSFADPVNLGTYLFAAFMISWYTGNNVLTVLL